ncbi:RNA chaperone Hfq [Ruminococcus sp. Marseille-P6503]|uniref:RNA chaperone Hfq n=1 Tax=Ruminococcus sp. Marseille-P6503 TaxID=2364796 RepID=UPI000F525D36|nr:RNA chaperone Hfq [Ruminococcus sp. Marseille-P6503]
MNKNLNLQDVFLNQARKDRVPVTIFLMNGYQFKGMVKGFDSYIVILDCEGKQNVVYKHAISTIVPARPINVLDAAEQQDDN